MLLLGSHAPAVDAFAPSGLMRSGPTTTNMRLFASDVDQKEETTSSPCVVPEGNEQIVNAVSAQALRSSSLLDFEGKRIMLGDVMKEGTSIVVFLRHLG